MKTKFNEFVNESNENKIELPIRDEKYDFLLDICKKSGDDYSQTFYVKEPLEIGTCGKHKLYLNYISRNNYEDRLSFWFIYNEHKDKLYGTSWDSGVLYEEDDELKNTNKHGKIIVYPNYMDIIYDTIKGYTDLNSWVDNLKEISEKHRKYQSWAINRSNKRTEKDLTWDERLDWVQNRIDSDRLLNRHSKPFEQTTLDEMLKLGEEEYNKVNDERNKMMMDIFNEMEEEGLLKK